MQRNPLKKYSALDEFLYKGITEEKEGIMVLPGPGGNTIADWNRGLKQFYIVITEMDGQEVEKSLHEVMSDLPERAKSKYKIREAKTDTSESKLFEFTDKDCLRLFFEDYLFNKVVNVNQKKLLAESAMKHFHQGGLPYVARALAVNHFMKGKLITEKSSEDLNKRLTELFGRDTQLHLTKIKLGCPAAIETKSVFYPMASGVQIKEKESIKKLSAMSLDENPIPLETHEFKDSLLDIECETSFKIVRGTVQIDAKKLDVAIYHEIFRDYDFGYGFKIPFFDKAAWDNRDIDQFMGIIKEGYSYEEYFQRFLSKQIPSQRARYMWFIREAVVRERELLTDLEKEIKELDDKHFEQQSSIAKNESEGENKEALKRLVEIGSALAQKKDSYKAAKANALSDFDQEYLVTESIKSEMLNNNRSFVSTYFKSINGNNYNLYSHILRKSYLFAIKNQKIEFIKDLIKLDRVIQLPIGFWGTLKSRAEELKAENAGSQKFYKPAPIINQIDSLLGEHIQWRNKQVKKTPGKENKM